MGFIDKIVGRNPAHVSHKLKGKKRLPGESFKSYKKRLKEEARLLKNYLRGDLVWCAKAFNRTTLGIGPDGTPAYAYSVDHQKSKGTYIKSEHGIIKSPRRT